MLARLSPVALRNLDDAHLEALAGRGAFSRAQRSALCLTRNPMFSSTWRDAADLAGAHILILDSPAQARLVPYVVESYYTEIQLDHVAWARLLRDKVHRLTLAECKLDTVIAVARALFAHPTIDVAYTRLEIYETDNRDALICSILESGLRAEAWALDPSALDGFTLNVYAARADGDAWYALTKLSA